MKKKFGITLLSIATFICATHSVNALTTYEADDWEDGSGYGTATEVDDNITNIKGETVADGGMFYGPYSKASTAKLADGITEETYIMLDPEKYNHGEFFQVSLGLKNGADEYVNEAVVMTQKVDDAFKLTAGWASDFSATVTRKGIYTYQWKMFIDNGKTYVNFTLLQGNREIATTGNIDFDTVDGPDSKDPIADEADVSVKYLWFCNVQVANGVDVYTELPTVKLTFVDPTGGDDDLVLDVYQYASFTTEEVDDLKAAIEEAAQTEGYTFVGFYADEDYTTEYDLTTPFEQDTTVYIKVDKVTTDTSTDTVSTANPKTSDINLFAMISMIVVAVSGLVFVLGKRFAKSH
ncbi:MAG: InlB B-repeat-containing protein [Erysipelotrichaceae bacterium]|nr:InlB B-repeat-containing protein [Erysipelotrichaceae bacterium]